MHEGARLVKVLGVVVPLVIDQVYDHLLSEDVELLRLEAEVQQGLLMPLNGQIVSKVLADNG